MPLNRYALTNIFDMLRPLLRLHADQAERHGLAETLLVYHYLNAVVLPELLRLSRLSHAEAEAEVATLPAAYREVTP